MLQYIVGALQKLAATRDAAVVVLTQCATRMQAERRATLIPAITANVWSQGITTRVALFRDWMWHDGHASGARLAAVQKVNGKVTLDALETVYAFKIESVCYILPSASGDYMLRPRRPVWHRRVTMAKDRVLHSHPRLAQNGN